MHGEHVEAPAWGSGHALVTKVTKALAPPEVDHLLGLKQLGSQLPYTVHVVAKSKSEFPGLHKLTIQPICDPTCQTPKTEEKLKSAIRAVLRAL